MAPINTPNGGEVNEIVLPNGNTASEVIAPDGSTVFSAIPDSGLLHNYDARDLSLNDGDSVNTWVDLEGGDDLTAGTSPTYKDSVINGNAIVRHDGVDDKLTTAFSSTQPDPFHVFVVGQLGSTSDPNNQYIVDGNGTSDFEIGLTEGNDKHWDWFDGSNNPSSGVTSDTNPHILDLKVAGSNSELFLDGLSILTGTHDETDLSGLTTGVRADDFGYGEFDHGQVLIYDASASGFSASDVRSYLSGGWGISI